MEEVSVELDVHSNMIVQSDRHKLLQILVQILRNAKEALRVDGEKRIEVKTEVAGESFRILIRDTGCGIAPENLDRVFRHGFTTKIEGNGFGLHNAANAAHELGGSLEVASDGNGCGALLTLTLPISRS